MEKCYLIIIQFDFSHGFTYFLSLRHLPIARLPHNHHRAEMFKLLAPTSMITSILQLVERRDCSKWFERVYLDVWSSLLDWKNAALLL